MEGTLAVLGFWVFAIVFVVKRSDVKRAQALGYRPSEMQAALNRIAALEDEVSLMNHQMIELKDGHDFTLKLLKSGKDTVK